MNYSKDYHLNNFNGIKNISKAITQNIKYNLLYELDDEYLLESFILSLERAKILNREINLSIKHLFFNYMDKDIFENTKTKDDTHFICKLLTYDNENVLSLLRITAKREGDPMLANVYRYALLETVIKDEYVDINKYAHKVSSKEGFYSNFKTTKELIEYTKKERDKIEAFLDTQDTCEDILLLDKKEKEEIKKLIDTK